MKKVLHIFTKDVRHLWPEIVAIIALWVFATWLAPDLWLTWEQQGQLARFGGAYLPLLLALSWCFLIVRVIQEDKLVGNRQFWVTRPYGWKSLLVAKLLFIALFFNLPMLISDSIMLSRAGFRPTDYVLGLIWKQLLLTIVLALPAMVVATLTTNFAQAVLAGIVLCVVVIASASLSAALPMASGLYAVEWIRTCLELLVGAFACVAILLWQYSRRERTMGLRLLAASVALVAILHIAMPRAAIISFEYRHSAAFPGFSSMQVNYDPPATHVPQTEQSGVPGSVHFQIPIKVSGLPQGYALAGDAVKVSIETADHHTWQSHWQNSSMVVSSLDDNHSAVDFWVSDSVFEQAEADPANLRLTLALTLLKEHTVTAAATEEPFRVPGVGICAVSGKKYNTSIFCRSPLRQPYQYFISYDWMNSPCFSTGNLEALRSNIPPGRNGFLNKDPLPAEFVIMPIVSFNLGSMSGAFQNWENDISHDVSFGICPGVHVSVTTQEAVARTRRDLEISNLRVADYQIKSSQ